MTATRLPGGTEAPPDLPETADPDALGERSVSDVGGRPDDRSRTGPWRGFPDAGLGVLVAGILALVAARPLTDNSFLTHLATGRVMLDSGIPTTNPFLYSSSEFPIPSWLWSAILGIVDAVTGGTGIRILTAACAAVLGLLVVRLTRPDEGRTGAMADRTLLSVVLPAACVVITLMPFVNARPQLPGYILLALTVLVLKERRSVWWLVPILAVWVNVHGTWFYGLGVLGLLLAAQVIDDRCLQRRQVLTVIAAGLGVLLGGLAQPDRFQTVLLPFEQFGDERARRALSTYVEWRPAGFDHPLTWLLIAMGLVALFGAIGRGRGGDQDGDRDGADQPRSWGVLVASVGLVAMGLSAGRLLPLAAITLVPWVAAGLMRLQGIALPEPRVQKVLVAVGAALGFCGLLWTVATPSYDLGRYPVAAVDWLEQRSLAGQPDVEVLTHDFAGNYLDWRFEERANTFVDDRPGVDGLIDYATLKYLGDGWQDALDRADPDVVVWSSEDPLTAELTEPEWYRAVELDGFTVVCRSSIADRCR